MTPILSTDTAITLVGGGPVAAPDLHAAVALAPLVVAADGGLLRACEHGQKVAHVIGDMDSAPRIDGPQYHEIPEQMTTDLDKCLYSTCAPFYIGVGFLGGRLDHELAACHALVKAPAQHVVLLGERDLCFLAPRDFRLNLPVGTRLSLFPMGPVRGESGGLEYPLAGLDFAPDGMIGTSNRVTGPLHLRFDAPKMLLLLPKAHLTQVVRSCFLS